MTRDTSGNWLHCVHFDHDTKPIDKKNKHPASIIAFHTGWDLRDVNRCKCILGVDAPGMANTACQCGLIQRRVDQQLLLEQPLDI